MSVTLQNRADMFVPGDVLTVGVELTVFGEHVSREVNNKPAEVEVVPGHTLSWLPNTEHPPIVSDANR